LVVVAVAVAVVAVVVAVVVVVVMVVVVVRWWQRGVRVTVRPELLGGLWWWVTLGGGKGLGREGRVSVRSM
jgi:hypothetical protein